MGKGVWVSVFCVIGVWVRVEASVDDGHGRVCVDRVAVEVVVCIKGGQVVGRCAEAGVLSSDISHSRLRTRMDVFGVVFVKDFLMDEGRVFGLLGE